VNTPPTTEVRIEPAEVRNHSNSLLSKLGFERRR
jgi:hypothetical protein